MSQILAARSRSVWMTFLVASVTTMPAANVTRLPPVSCEKGSWSVSPISALTLRIVDAKEFGADVDHRGAGAADVGVAGDDDDVAILGDVDGGG